MVSFHYFLGFLIVSTLFSSCITDRKLERAYQKSVYFKGYPKQAVVDGLYANGDIHAEGHESLFYRMVESNHFIREQEDPPLSIYKPETLDVGRVELAFNGGKRLLIKAGDSASQVPHFRLRVKDKGRYISVHRQTELIPIPGFFAYSRFKMILLNDPNGQLIAVSGRGTFAEVFFIIPALSIFYNIDTFNRLL